MNVDLALGVAIALFAVWGAFSGAARQLAQAVAAVVGWLLGSQLGELMGPLAAKQLRVNILFGAVIATAVAFVLVFLSVRLALTAVLKRLLDGKEGKRVGLDRALGMLLGAAKAALVGFLVLCALSFLEDNVSVLGKKLSLSPKDSLAMRLAKEHNVFELAHRGELEDLSKVLKMSQDPAQAKRLQENADFQQLKKDPRFSALLGQQAAWERALATGDARSLLKDDSLMKLMSDGDLMRRVERLASLQR